MTVLGLNNSRRCFEGDAVSITGSTRQSMLRSRDIDWLGRSGLSRVM